MVVMSLSSEKTQHWLQTAARLVALIWAGWWVFFGVASGFSEGLEPLGILIHTAVPGLIFLALAIIAWFREGIGGALLIIAGLLIIVLYPIMAHGSLSLTTILITVVMLALPPLLAGALCLACWRQTLPNY